MAFQVYCVKCKSQTDTRDLQPTVMKNGRDAVAGVCAACGTKKYRIGKMPVEA